MAALTIRLHERRLPLKAPFGTGRWKLTEREVIILDIFDPKSGFTGYGEAAPLEPFGTERYSVALSELTEFIATADFTKALDMRTDALPGFTEILTASPTARFAVESALLDLRAKREGVPLRMYLGGNEDDETLPVNAVIGDSSVAETYTAIRRAVDAGYRCIKMKAGARELAEDIDRVSIARENAGDAMLRIDVNGAWSRKIAESAIAKLESLSIEYIEQPLDKDDRDGMAGLAGESPIPIAADESLQVLEDIEYFAGTALPVFILKPMALGGMLRLRETALALHSQGKKIVVTSFIDSAIGRSAAMHFAASMPFLMQTHHGLDTGRLFACELADIEGAKDGMLRLPSGNGIGVLTRLDEAP